MKPKKPVSTVKFSIKNILNLDDAEDLVNGPPVIELGADKNEGVIHGGSVPPISQLSQMPPQAFAHSYPTPSYLGMYSHSIPNMQNMYFNHFSQLPHFLNNKILHWAGNNFLNFFDRMITIQNQIYPLNTVLYILSCSDSSSLYIFQRINYSKIIQTSIFVRGKVSLLSRVIRESCFFRFKPEMRGRVEKWQSFLKSMDLFT